MAVTDIDLDEFRHPEQREEEFLDAVARANASGEPTRVVRGDVVLAVIVPHAEIKCEGELKLPALGEMRAV